MGTENGGNRGGPPRLWTRLSMIPAALPAIAASPRSIRAIGAHPPSIN